MMTLANYEEYTVAVVLYFKDTRVCMHLSVVEDLFYDIVGSSIAWHTNKQLF